MPIRGRCPNPPTGSAYSTDSMNSDDSLSHALADLDALLAAGLAAFGKATTPEQVEAAARRVPRPEARPGQDRAGAAQVARAGIAEGIRPAIQRRQGRS